MLFSFYKSQGNRKAIVHNLLLSTQNLQFATEARLAMLQISYVMMRENNGSNR